MSDGELRIMLPRTIPQPGQTAMYPPYQARSDYATHTAPSPLPNRQPVEVAQPLEPRSNGHAPGVRTGESAPRHFESTSYRPPGQTLPGLREILPPTSNTSPQQPQSTWSQAPVPRYEQRPLELPTSHQSNTHSTHAYHSTSEPQRPYAAQSDRRLDLPILETQPVSRQPPQMPHAAPYASYTADGREAVEVRYDRPRQTSASSYMTAGAPSPYTPLPGDASAHRSSTASYDRSGNPPFTPTGAEASKKYLGIKDFPGEGTFHVYEGGYRIPTSVDGESVNPQWGLTKANKPRKRLALACLDCREKKIKCEPGASSCLQCEKAKRPCRRAPNQTSSNEANNNSQWPSEAASPPLMPHPHAGEMRPDVAIPMHRTTDSMAAKSNHFTDQDSLAKRRAQDENAAEGAPFKKHRSISPQTPYASTMGSSHPSQPHYFSRMPPYGPKSQAFVSWEDDPYAIDPELSIFLLESYFTNVNSATYCMFPRNTFMNWLTTSREKCQNERMVLYALLAMGSIFSGQEYAGIGKRCAELAAEGSMSKIGRFAMPVIQVRLLLALYNFAKGNEGAAWDYCGLALRAISALRFNNEEGCEISPRQQNPILPFGLTRYQSTECRRRTFWSGFMMDRYNGFCGGMLCTINPADIYLRLPCADDAFESSIPSQAPFYDNGSIDRTLTTLNPSSPVAPMAWLVIVGGLWGEAMNFIYRATTHDRITYRPAYEKIYNHTHSAMHEWSSQLPGYLQYSEANLERSIQGGYVGTFVSIHVLHHFVLMKLNRCMRHTLAPDLTPRNIRAAHYHAHRILSMMRAIQMVRRDVIHPPTGQSIHWDFSVPFSGFATLSAVDIIGAGGPESTIGPTLEGISSGLECLRELAQFWSSAVEQSRNGERRLLQLKNVLSRPYKAPSGCWLGRHWGIEGPLEQEFELESDCIYGCDDKIYFSALEEGTANERSGTGGARNT